MASASPLAARCRAETELLCCCARRHVDPGTAERIQGLLREELDWEYLLQTAQTHGVLALLCWNVSRIGSQAVPAAILDRLKEGYRTNAARCLFLTAELLRLLRLFQGHGITAVPFKGPVLAAEAYGDQSLRQYGDLDILVRPRDLPRAAELLVAHGYRGEAPPPGGPSAADRSSKFHLTFQRADGHVTVELHWRFSGDDFPFPLDLEALAGRLKPVRLAGTPVLHLSPEDLLLILCVHGARHGWRALIWIADLAALLPLYPALDWGQMLEQARSLRSERMLAVGLLLAHELLGADLPAAVLQWIQDDRTTRALAAQVRQRLFIKAEGPLELLEVYLYPSQLRECPSDRIRYGFHIAARLLQPNSHDRALVSLPPGLSFLYFLLRPLRLAGHYALIPCGRFLRFLRFWRPPA